MMWWFLGLIAGMWLVFGSVQDWRTREISDWVTLSLLVIGMGTRAIFAFSEKDFNILAFGILATVFLLSISFIFYYTKVFAGGDFKLLTGLGPFIPGMNFETVIFNCAAVIVILLCVGFVYSLIMSCVIAVKNSKLFLRNFNTKKQAYLLIIPAIAVCGVVAFIIKDNVITILMVVISLALVAYPYLLAVDGCMIRRYNPKKLTPGDWLVEDVKVAGRTIKSSVHGLSEKEIAFLQKHRKNVLIKEGIPFVPAFLLTFIIMVFFFALKGQNFFVELLAVV